MTKAWWTLAVWALIVTVASLIITGIKNSRPNPPGELGRYESDDKNILKCRANGGFARTDRWGSYQGCTFSPNETIEKLVPGR